MNGRRDGPRSVVFHHDSHGFGGMEMYLFDLIDRLDRERYTPALLVPGFTDEFRSSQQRVVDEARARAIPLLRPPDPGQLPGVSAVRELAAVTRLLRRHGTDVVHIHTCRPLGARKIVAAAALARVPAVVRTEHYPPSVTASAADRNRVRPFDWLTDYIVTGSESDRREQLEILKRPAEKVICCHNSVAVERFDPDHDVRRAKAELGLDPDVPVVVNIGRLVEQKGQRYLIEAMTTVVERCGPVNLVIVGEGELRSDLEELRDRLGLSRWVRLVGHCDDVRPYVRAADVATIPSLYEVFSLAMLEYMAMGKATVASDHPSFTEAITDGVEGLIVPRQQSGPLAAALIRLLAEPEVRTAMGRAASRRVREHFALDRLAEETMQVYDRACASLRRSHAPSSVDATSR
jgi:glycosyltransferase involved in cell wall biosynthesis